MTYELKYVDKLGEIFDKIKVFKSRKQVMPLGLAFGRIHKMLKSLENSDNKLIFIGNGGSAAIASHMAIDFWKNGRLPAISFNEGSLLTCIGNDYGFEYVFEKPVEMFAKEGDVMVAISSSGASKNILNATKTAKRKGVFVITLSGFSDKNPLLKCGDLNFYVPSNIYGIVEISHQVICHAILDSYMKTPI